MTALPIELQIQDVHERQAINAAYTKAGGRYFPETHRENAYTALKAVLEEPTPSCQP